MTSNLPIPAEMLSNADELLGQAYALLGDAEQELLSDFPPGVAMTAEQAETRTRMRLMLRAARMRINDGRLGGEGG